MRNHRGFTLIEMLIVIVVIAVLASIIIPKLFGAVASSKESKRDAIVKTLQDAVNLYEADTGGFPATLAVLASTTRPDTNQKYVASVPANPVSGGGTFESGYDAGTGVVSTP
jgi:general secretion pathway protein G